MGTCSIVILNWNGKQFLEDFLPSVIAHSSDAQIIVADNASTDDSVAFLRENYPQLRIIQNDSNGGFAKGYNDALVHVDSEYYLLLNSDIEVSENWLSPLLKHMDDPAVAGVQPKIRAYHDRQRFEHAGASGGFLDKNYFPFCRGRIFHHFEEDQGQYNDSMEVFWATGAALLIRSKVFHELGGFDEQFFAHMEEIDLCWRAKNRGYKFMVEPASVVYHVGGGTLSYMSPRKTYLNFRNSLYMITKNHPGWLYPMLFKRLIIDGIAGLHFLLRGEFKSIGAVLKAHMHLYSNLGSLLKQRKALRRDLQNVNKVGMYRASIVWALYFKRIKRFSDLNQRFFVK